MMSGERCSTVPYVKPGGEILLRLSGWPKVERALQLIDSDRGLSDERRAALRKSVTDRLARLK